MFKKLSRSWELTKESFNVLTLDKELMVFPIVSAVATIALLASLFVPAATMVDWQNVNLDDSSLNAISLAVLFVFYFVTSFVVMFCNTALLHCAKIRFEGGDPTVADGFSAGFKNVGKIAVWAAISGTIGVVLAQLEERLGFLGTMIRKVVGGAWIVITYFAVPVMIFENISPTESIKRSKDVVQKMWGEALVGHVGMSYVQSLFGLGGLLVFFASIPLAIKMDNMMLIGGGFGLAMLVWLGTAIVFSCLAQIYRAALYIYATTNEPPRAFRKELLEGAFN